MSASWDATTPGVVVLPSGRRVRGRSLRRPLPDGGEPDFGVYLLGRKPAPTAWEVRWVRWPDFLLPVHRRDARDALHQAWSRAVHERVEVACAGGRGRTGTALACIAVLDGMSPSAAVEFVRRHYDARSIETPWQRRYVAHF